MVCAALKLGLISLTMYGEWLWHQGLCPKQLSKHSCVCAKCNSIQHIIFVGVGKNNFHEMKGDVGMS